MAAVLALSVLLGMAAIGVDLGNYASHRRQLQNAADSIALAASRDLPNATAAQTSAQQWAAKNGIAWGDVSFAVIPQGASNPNPKVRVDVREPHEFAFMRVLGIRSRTVAAHAAAIKTSPGGVGGLMPWSVDDSVAQGAAPGAIVTVKYDANNVANGNFGPLSLDGTGSSVYETTIEKGSTSIVCARGVATCTTVSPECSGWQCPTQPGNVVGPTRTGVDYRMTNTDSRCDQFDEVFTSPVNGRYTINARCNPWLSGSYPSLRVFIVPVIETLCNGRCDVTVTGFALFWLEGFGSGGCTGNSCEVKGRFVDAEVSVDALTGVYDPAASITFTRLAE
jgi:hypothetical protein